MPETRASELRREIIKKEFSRMNPEQFRAVTTVKGQVLILAGAGSGKTTVLVNRAACLLKFGDAYRSDSFVRPVTHTDVDRMERFLDGDESVWDDIADLMSVDAPEPWRLLAITFTNKAAGELKDRICSRLGEAGSLVNASTFHSACLRILRREADKLGYSSHFTVYDTDDSKRIIKDCLKQIGINDKFLPPKNVLAVISRAKDELISPDEYESSAKGDMRKENYAKLYRLYDSALKRADAMDFDDIIVNTVRLLRSDPDALDHYRRLYRYIMVDEYQDTNYAQYVLVSLLAGENGNLCVVGDDDQSIYKFRGATIKNILEFEDQYPGAALIKLETNYRSTGNILAAANAVISHNTQRKGKTLRTDKDKGDKVVSALLRDDREEGTYIADEIAKGIRSGEEASSYAILYRMNAQSGPIERALVNAGISYRIVGGHKFYDRAEIKDMLAYMAVAVNPSDELRLNRIVNVPKRGLGAKSLSDAAYIAQGLGVGLMDVFRTADEYAALTKGAAKMKTFADLIDRLSEVAETSSCSELLTQIVELTGYKEYLAEDQSTFEDRVANINELLNEIVRYEDEQTADGGSPDVISFLENVALLSDIDSYNDQVQAVVLMTLHSSKGLEFPYVYIIGMENGVFPSSGNLSDPDQLEEERRLAYVGITRAKKKLTLTRASTRMLYGRTTANPPSVFIQELPADNVAEYSTVARRSVVTRSPENGFASKTPLRPRPAAPVDYKLPDVAVGDRVRHKIFGEGLVVKCDKMGNDLLLEVAFDFVGTKKLMAKAARLEKL